MDSVVKFQEALQLAPRDSNSWLRLAELHDSRGQRLPAFFCYARFLTLEPESSRSAVPAERLWDLLFQGVGAGSIAIPPPGGSDDPWWEATLLMSMVASMRSSEKGALMSDAEFFATALEGVAIVLDNYVGEKQVSPFWSEHVVPYFNAARQEGHIEAMAYYIRQSTGSKKIKKWLAKHPDEVGTYRDWSEQWRP